MPPFSASILPLRIEELDKYNRHLFCTASQGWAPHPTGSLLCFDSQLTAPRQMFPQEFLPLTFSLSEPKPTQKSRSVQTQCSLLCQGFLTAVATLADVFYPSLSAVHTSSPSTVLLKAKYSLKATIAESGCQLQARWVLCANHYNQTKETQTIQMASEATNSISAEGLQFHISLTHHPLGYYHQLVRQ